MLQDTLSFISVWYNLPFTAMLCLCVLLSALQLFGLGDDGDADADADVDLDTDFDLHADVDLHADLDLHADVDLHLDGDLDMDGDLDIDTDAHIDGDLDDLGALSILAFLGIGKAPLLVVLLILLGSTGILGWVLNGLVQTSFNSYPGWAFAFVLPLALIGSSFISSRTSRFIGRALPPISTTATSVTGLVGRRGTVISPHINQKYGLVRVRDRGGTLINVFAITQDDQDIPGQTEVALVEYDPDQKRYTVAPISYKNS